MSLQEQVRSEAEGTALSAARGRVLDIAKRCAGLKASDPETRAEFKRMLGPAPLGGWDLDHPFRCWRDSKGVMHVEGVSTCALFAYQVLVEAGLLSQRPSPYAAGTIETVLENAAHFAGAWRTTGQPKPGDIINIDNPSHWLVLTSVEPQKALSIDAGQTDEKGLQCIKECSRSYVPGSIGGRKVHGWIDIDGLKNA